MTTTSDILGKPQRVRKLEFLIRYYTEQQVYQNQIDDKMRYDNLIGSLQREYKFLTGENYHSPQSTGDDEAVLHISGNGTGKASIRSASICKPETLGDANNQGDRA